MERLDEMLVANWYNDHSFVPSSYIQPPECRPGNLIGSGDTIPVVDLGGHDRAETVKFVLKASEEYGFFQMISNGRLIGAEHRAVTNSSTSRTSVSYFVYPSSEAIIEPAKALIHGTTKPTYRSMTYAEFRGNFFSKGPKLEEELLYS